MTTNKFEKLEKEITNLNNKINLLSENKTAYLDAANSTADKNLQDLLDAEYDNAQAEIDVLVKKVWQLDAEMSEIVETHKTQ